MAKSTTSNISIRMDSDLKAAAEALYEELGMNLSTAFNIFVRQSLRERGIPFKITEGTPSKETVSAPISPDWLLIYRYDDDVLVLTLTRTGSHSDLFNL